MRKLSEETVREHLLPHREVESGLVFGIDKFDSIEHGCHLDIKNSLALGARQAVAPRHQISFWRRSAAGPPGPPAARYRTRLVETFGSNSTREKAARWKVV